MDANYIWNHISKKNTWIKVKPTLVEPHSLNGFGKVPFAKSGPPNWTNTGDIHQKKDSHIS